MSNQNDFSLLNADDIRQNFDDFPNSIDFSTVQNQRVHKDFAYNPPALLAPLITKYQDLLTFPLLWSNDPMQVPLALFSPEVSHHVLAYLSLFSFESVKKVSQKASPILTVTFTIVCFSADTQFVQQSLDAVVQLSDDWCWKFVKIPKTFLAFSTQVSEPVDLTFFPSSSSCPPTDSIVSVDISSQLSTT